MELLNSGPCTSNQQIRKEETYKKINHEIDSQISLFRQSAKSHVEKLCYVINNYPKKQISEKISPVLKNFVEFLRKERIENFMQSPRNVFSCQMCQGVLSKPVTISCGHTFCKGCLYHTVEKCFLCGKRVKDVSEYKCNILILTIVNKCWPNQTEVLTLGAKAKEFFERKEYDAALQIYSKAIEEVPHDHILMSERSHTLQLLGRSEEALKDAKATCRICPTWPNGYFRKASAFISLGRHEEALVALLTCCFLESKENLPNVESEITKLFLLIMSKIPQNPSDIQERQQSTVSHLKKSIQRAVVPHTIYTDEKGKSSKVDRPCTLSCRKRKISRCKSEQLKNERSLFMNRVLDQYHHDLSKDRTSSAYHRTVEGSTTIEKSYFECTLCFHYFHQPVSTPCGHTFCRTCLDRSLDHSVQCPLCKACLRDYLKERRSSTTEFIVEAMKILFPHEFISRENEFEAEMKQFANAGKDNDHEIPIFVATLAIPSVPCPLHVFEPRYRLMIRRCIESGTREFGMCMPVPEEENGYANVGTMLKINDVEYSEDGRSIVSTIGTRRFRCLSKGTKDGYNTAKVEFFEDVAVPLNEVEEVKKSHDAAFRCAKFWFEKIEGPRKERILESYGPMPDTERNYLTQPNGPSWLWWFIAILPLEADIQMKLLQEVSLKRRLSMTIKIVKCVSSYQKSRES